jgi:hypothetical protein
MGNSMQFLKTLDKLMKVKGEVDNIMKVPKSASMALNTRATGQLSASSDNLNRLRAIGSNWNNALLKLTLHDENWWIDWSGTNLLSAAAAEKAVKKTRKLREKMVAMEKGCKGLADLAKVVFVSENMDIKGLARLYIPSIVAIDAIVLNEAISNFKACSNNAARVRKKLDLVIPTLEETWRAARKFRTGVSE